MKPRTLLLLLLVATAVACGRGVDATGDETAGDGDGTGAPTGAWQLVEGHGPAGPVPILEDHRITLSFEEDGTAGGTAACNHYGGDVTTDGDAITFAGFAVTEMGCMPQDVMDAERAYLDAVAQVTTFEQADDRLVLTGPDTELVFQRLAPPPTAELVATRWELDGLVRGSGPDGAVSSVGGDGHLVLEEDGTLLGSTGCRELSGEWTRSGDTITPTTLTAEGECSADLRVQDAHVIEVLEGFRAEVDGQRLTLTTPNGESGLVYRSG